MLLNKKLLLGISIPSIGSLGIFGFLGITQEYKIMVNYNGQADLLLSLQIPPDYYPYQFKKTNLYDYLTNVDKYIVVNEKVSREKKEIKNKLQNRINHFLSHIKEFGPSLWNEGLYDTGIVYRNNQFWSNKKTTLLFIEQFIADDYTDISESYDLLPSHKKLIITNYRAARDPYTIFSKEVFECFKKENSSCTTSSTNKQLAEKFKKYMEEYSDHDANSLYRFGKFIDFWNDLQSSHKDQLKKLKFSTWIKDDSYKNLFSLDSAEDSKLAKKYLATVFTPEEVCLLNKWAKGQDGSESCENDGTWKMNYKSTNALTQKIHHPALEQQILPGTAPLSEGSQKDIIVFLYQFAASIDSYTKNSHFEENFKDDYRKEAMKNALNNVYQISEDIHTRIKNIRDYFKDIGVVDNKFDPQNGNHTTTDSKTFTALTYPPSAFGAGEATIQSMSKFPWLYQDIGLKQPIPSNLKDSQDHEDLSKEIFSVDDNGWWWKIGSANLDPTNLLKFKDQTDTLLILANEDDWALLQDKSSGILDAAASLLKNKNIKKIDFNKVQGNEPKLKNNKGYPVSYNKYHLWNEGLRSPIALNLLLDNLVDIFQRQYDNSFKDKYKEAMNWGIYWQKHFLDGTNASDPSDS